MTTETSVISAVLSVNEPHGLKAHTVLSFLEQNPSASKISEEKMAHKGGHINLMFLGPLLLAGSATE